MRVQGTLLLLAGVVLGLSTGACGDDDDDGSAGASGASSSSGGATGSGGAGQTVSCTVAADSGACRNATDCPKVETGEIRTAAQSCGLGCLANADPSTCTVMCIVTETGATSGCSTCYAALAGCAAQKCLASCAADPASAACNQCQIDQGCRSAFDTCSGLDSAN